MMKHLISAILLVCAAVFATACEKPKEDDCKRAVDNIRKLYGTDSFAQGVPPQAAVRSCRGSATTESVRCMATAKTLEELNACTGDDEFLEAMKEQAPPAQEAPPAQAPPAQEPPADPAAQEAPPAQAPPAQEPPAQEPPAQEPPAQEPPADPAAE